MLLVVDVGNSNIVMGGYQAGRLRFTTRLATDIGLEADQYAVQLRAILQLYGVEQETIEQVYISSVVPAITPVLLRALAHFSGAVPHLISHKDAGDITVDIERPTELGVDILVSAIAVRHSRPLPAVIIDMGTATKITALDADKKLLGVAISPGLFVSLDALVRRASALGGISLEAPEAAIGRNTSQSMKSGVVLGTAAMLDGMIDRFEAEMGGLATVVATGGGAPVVVPHCRHQVEYSNTLLLEGLYAVAQAQGYTG